MWSYKRLPQWLNFACVTFFLIALVSPAHAGTGAHTGWGKGGIKRQNTTANGVPTISGSPAGTVVAGSTYSFLPSASDPDGDTLTFSVANKPAWASFNTSTGRLSGTPGSGQVGSYSGITIAVSDGQDTASLPAFTIAVDSASATGSASLSWVAPTTRSDGSPISLSEIAGFRIYHGTTSGDLTLLRDLGDNSATSYTVTDLEPATHYFAATSYDYDGNESSYSDVISKTVQ